MATFLVFQPTEKVSIFLYSVRRRHCYVLCLLENLTIHGNFRLVSQWQMCAALNNSNNNDVFPRSNLLKLDVACRVASSKLLSWNWLHQSPFSSLSSRLMINQAKTLEQTNDYPLSNNTWQIKVKAMVEEKHYKKTHWNHANCYHQLSSKNEKKIVWKKITLKWT